MWDRRERDVLRALRAIRRQRAVLIQPNGLPVIELGPPDAEWFEVAVVTAQMRGWVDVLHRDVPVGTIRFDNQRMVLPQHMPRRNIYRLTEGGWYVLRRSHGWVLATFWTALLIGSVGIVATLWTGNKLDGLGDSLVPHGSTGGAADSPRQ